MAKQPDWAWKGSPSRMSVPIQHSSPQVSHRAFGEHRIRSARRRPPCRSPTCRQTHVAAAHSYRDLRRALNDAVRLIGRLNVERYDALVELAELKGLPAPEPPADQSWHAASRPSGLPPSWLSASAATHRGTRKRATVEEDLIDAAELRAIARRRQTMVLGTAVVIALCLLVYHVGDWHWFPNLLDRRALTEMAGIGLLMQLMFPVFFLLRVVTLTGKGKRWLFPTAAEEAAKRRRQRIQGR